MIKAVPNLQIFLVLFFFSLALMLLDSSKLLSLPQQGAFYITNPVSFGLYKSSTKSISQLNFVFRARHAAQENKALKEQLGELLSENATLRKRLAETEAQISQENYIDARTYNLKAARPIGLGRYLKIDQGQTSQIAQNQAVVVNDNYVGKIIQVSEKASLIQLLTDPDSKVSAFSIGKTGKAKGVLLGQFGTELLMDKILHEEEIAVGDLVYSEGTEGFLPRGLILGRVKEVLSRENEIFKQAKVEQIFDIRDLELVFIIRE